MGKSDGGKSEEDMLDQLIVIATSEEIALVKKQDQFTGLPVLVAGVGPLNIIRALKDIPKDTQIINIGYAGSADLEIGREYRVSVSRLLHKEAFQTPEFVIGYGVPCYSSADFVVEAHEKGCLYDMELAFICALGFRDVLSIKTVSDHCNYKEYNDAVNG